VEILRSLRKGEFDVLVGINLLREGLDLPEVSLVAILDADKEGYLRSTTSLTQTAGRAARHINGEVILYADVMTKSINQFLATTNYRREKQIAYNKEHGITPRSVSRAVDESLAGQSSVNANAAALLRDAESNFDVTETIRELEDEMLKAADNLEFEKAALMRDQIQELRRTAGLTENAAVVTAAGQASYRKGGKRKKAKA
jgi:excinuclease ABC subunit B